MTEQNSNSGSDRQQQNTGSGSRQQEQQTGGGNFDNERRNPGTTGSDQTGAGQMEQGGSYRPQGDRGVQFDSDEGQDIDFQPEQQGGTPGQQGSGERRGTQQQEGQTGGGLGQPGGEQGANRGQQGGSGMGADTRGGNQTNR